MKEKNSNEYKNDLSGQVFGRLTVLNFAEKRGKYEYWHCVCECGKEKDISIYNLTSGRTSSCGCLQRECGKKYQKQNLHIYEGVQIEKAMAKTVQKNNTTGFRGVFKDKRTGKFRARIIIQGVRYELGYFDCAEEAAKARKKAEGRVDKIIEKYKSEKRT